MILGSGDSDEALGAALGGTAGGATALDERDAARFAECLQSGGVVVFPADTVYGLGCDPENELAVRRPYELKGRPAARPAAVMFFDLERALTALPELGARERRVMRALLPGPITLLLPNRDRRFPLAGGPGAEGLLGLRVPLLSGTLAALSAVPRPMMQSSANLSGGPEARRLEDVPRRLREGSDLALDGGELLGVASTVVDLGDYERTGAWRVLREGALAREALERALG
jgi:L-threonylcarbamoyladenylate synthase